jgi:hypothetical protein
MTRGRITSQRLAAVALLQLDGAMRAVDTEDLAMKMAALAPDRFRWKKYPEQINIDQIRYTVTALLRTDPPFASGGVRYGWMLTAAGITWALQTPGIAPEPVHEALAQHAALLRQTKAWEKFSRMALQEVTIYDARHFLRVDEYTSIRRRRERIQAVCNIAARDADLRALVVYLREQFPEEWA